MNVELCTSELGSIKMKRNRKAFWQVEGRIHRQQVLWANADACRPATLRSRSTCRMWCKPVPPKARKKKGSVVDLPGEGDAPTFDVNALGRPKPLGRIEDNPGKKESRRATGSKFLIKHLLILLLGYNPTFKLVKKLCVYSFAWIGMGN